ncbi:MAG: hypothetical protein EP338_09710 [Bacteroidetes bacterium]|nr:MAG: hypothetical protein EP338_09710 [Bacteroidota bacterium]
MLLTLLPHCLMSQVRPHSIPKRSFALDWIRPKAFIAPNVEQYSPMEWGLNLSDSLKAQVDFYLVNAYGSSLNPFDPEQIDIYGEFRLIREDDTLEKRVNAFFYQGFQRRTESPNLEKWGWKSEPGSRGFRLRFTPADTGQYEFQVYFRVKNREVAKLGPFRFRSVPGKRSGYMKIDGSGRYFELDEEPFVPVGQNLPKPSCYVQRDSVGNIVEDPYGCLNCPCAGIEDWCNHLKHLPMLPKPYMTYLEEVERFKEAGGNYFRMINFPFTYEIEYEKLGNYFDRLHCAWELDQLVNKLDELDLKMHFNLFLGYPVVKAQYGVINWDWYSDGLDDPGYCYRNELKLNEPHEFLTDPRAKRYYKNRLRYIISRWGYSTNIALFEMMSEINNKFPNHPKEVYAWQREMTDYIKKELGHTEHLLAVNYIGNPPSSKGDHSFALSSVDVITHNMHRATIRRNDLQKAWKKQRSYGKPLLFSEVGTGDLGFERCDQYSEWTKDLWAVLFSGSASAGLNWHEAHNVELWKSYEVVSDFLKPERLSHYDKPYTMLGRHKDKELLALIDPDHKRAMGMVHNLTWNYHSFSNGTGSCLEKDVPEQRYKTFHPVEGEKDRLKLKGMGSGNTYIIRWYDPRDGQEIERQEVKSGLFGKLLIPHKELDKERPFLLFKLSPPTVWVYDEH